MSSGESGVKSFTKWIKDDPSAEYPAEAGRYHLYISLACPFASRTNFFLSYKGLRDAISTSLTHTEKSAKGWEFADGVDTVNGKKYLAEIYKLAEANYTGSISVPVLFDKKTKTIVSNESGDIIRMLNSEFNAFCATDAQRQIDLYPSELRGSIDEWNSLIGDKVNSGVYRAGFAKTQEAYDDAVVKVFDTLDILENHLSKHRFLAGETFTEADVRLFMSLVRFDVLYHGLFKCNKRRLLDYPNLWPYTREIYQLPNVESTVDLQQIAYVYQRANTNINPFGIVSIGPVLDFCEAHGRDVKFGK